MLGNDAFGRKVSLLNDADCSSQSSSTRPTRPSLPVLGHRSGSGSGLSAKRAAAGPGNSKISLSHRPPPHHSHSSSAAFHHPDSRSLRAPSPPLLARGLSSTATCTTASTATRPSNISRNTLPRTWSCSSHTSHASDGSSSGTTPPSSNASSAETSPKLRPQAGHHGQHLRIPSLARNDSSTSTQSTDSARSGASLPTPSPMTPTYPFEPLDPQSKQAPHVDLYARAAASSAPYFGAVPAGGIPPGMAAGVLPTAPMPYYGANSVAAVAAVGAAAAPLVMDDTFGMAPQYPNLTNSFGYAVAPDMQPPAVPVALNLTTSTPSLAPATTATPTLPVGAPALGSHVSIAATSPTVASTVSPTSPTSATNPSSSGSSVAAPAAGSGGAAQPPKMAKKKYPCPHAQRFHCTDTFTTSGHAARHGKKHTGEKNILCPTCHKAFTRKDNMKQHERTHRQNRDAGGPAATAATTAAAVAATTASMAALTSSPTANQGSVASASASASPISPTTTGLRAITAAAAAPPSLFAHRPLPATLDPKTGALLAASGGLDAPLPSLTAPTASLSLGPDPMAAVDVMDFDIDPTTAPPADGFAPKAARVYGGGGGGSPGSDGGSPGLDALAIAAGLS